MGRGTGIQAGARRVARNEHSLARLMTLLERGEAALGALAGLPPALEPAHRRWLVVPQRVRSEIERIAPSELHGLLEQGTHVWRSAAALEPVAEALSNPELAALNTLFALEAPYHHQAIAQLAGWDVDPGVIALAPGALERVAGPEAIATYLAQPGAVLLAYEHAIGAAGDHEAGHLDWVTTHEMLHAAQPAVGGLFPRRDPGSAEQLICEGLTEAVNHQVHDLVGRRRGFERRPARLRPSFFVAEQAFVRSAARLAEHHDPRTNAQGHLREWAELPTGRRLRAIARSTGLRADRRGRNQLIEEALWPVIARFDVSLEHRPQLERIATAQLKGLAERQSQCRRAVPEAA